MITQLMIKYTLSHIVVYAFMIDAYNMKQNDKALAKISVMDITEDLIRKELALN